MVNINIEIPDELHRQLKLASILEEETLKEHVIRLLNTSLDLKEAKGKGRKG